MARFRYAAVVLIAWAVFAETQSNKPKPPRSSDSLVSQEVVISRTSSLTSEQLDDIAGKLTSVTMRDDDQEVEARIKYEFLQRGYFDAEVTNLKVVPLDPLAKKKPVRIEAEVSEGPLYRLAEFKFTGNEAFSTEELLKMFPLHRGDIFDAEKIRSGLEEIWKQYSSKGYFEVAPVPDTQKSANGQVTVTFAIEEGLQYRMGQLKINGKNDVAEKLQSHWEVRSGAPYDPSYLDQYLARNRELLPEGFNDDRDVLWLRDCSDNTINVTIELDPKRPWKPKPQDRPCEPPKKDAEKPAGS